MKKLLLLGVCLLLVLFSVSSRALAQLSSDGVIITTVLKEKFFDKEGNPLTGKGVLIGDIDSGVDIFHPMFFFADGGDYDWIDVNGDGVFSPGKDAVDIDGDGAQTDGEILRFIRMNDQTFGLLGERTNKFQPDMDFLYNDANNNRRRDFGAKGGFTENDPTYGEVLYIARDGNGNNVLDAGEKITALGTSKVRAVREKNGTVRRRGVDLILTEPDTIGHGTSVAGIVMGGHYGVQRLHGIAPDAEMIFANIDYEYTPRFVRNFTDLIRFIGDEGANILLFEDGEWGWEFLDGSSPEEVMADELARNGVTVIGGSGNLASGNMHIKDKISSGKTKTYTVECPTLAEGKTNDGVFVSFLWTETDNKLSFVVETPDGDKTKILSEGSGFFREGDFNIFYSRDVSPKGTVMFRLGFSEKDSGTVKGDWNIQVTAESSTEIDGYVVDVSQGWEGNSHWDSPYITDTTTVTFPSTADSCISVGAYVVNFPFFPGDVFGELCNYSGKGRNIDGKLGVDITAPGHTTFSAGTDNSYVIFSGTSAAAPHVVGTAALMLQYDMSLTQSQIKAIIFGTATRDKYTGSQLPNIEWGYGKLNIEGAVKELMKNN